MPKNEYQTELLELKRLKKVVLASLAKAPEGSVRCELAQGKYPQYYLCRKEEKEQYPKGRYLRKEEREIAKVYAQKEYDERMLEEIERREKVIRFLKKYGEKSELSKVFESMPLAKQMLAVPYLPTDEEYVWQWHNTVSAGQNTYPFLNSYTTERGEIVRSKSEKMIADKLYLKNIPYKYEAGLSLKNKVIYPDFTILRVKTREEVYLEHLGMMDEPEYCNRALEKISEYEENGIYLGQRLFVTFESETRPIDMVSVNRTIECIVGK